MYLDSQPDSQAIINYCLWYYPFVLVLVERRTGTESSSPSACCAFRFLGLPFALTGPFEEGSSAIPPHLPAPASSDLLVFFVLPFTPAPFVRHRLNGVPGCLLHALYT
jgi:hypothetical protein